MSANPSDLTANLGSLYDMILDGGPVMIPIALCSIVAFAYSVERWVRTMSARLGGPRLAQAVLGALREGGPARGTEVARKSGTALGRVLDSTLERWSAPELELEKTFEDAAYRESRRLVQKLRPLVVVAMIAPLLGLLGTVWGMIEAFSSIALEDGLGKPELLASGIAQALITTATGLAIAIPTQAVYYWLKARVDRFVRTCEDAWQELARLRRAAGETAEAA